MGVATGEADVRADDYFGPVLNRVSRVMSAGHGGQILVASSTASLVQGVSMVDLGERRLRGVPGMHRLFQVSAEGLRADFPPLRTVNDVRGNVPTPATSLVGRQAALDELASAVRAHRLVTLTGVGGVGKTRLALRVALDISGECPDGAWFVELAPIGDPDAVVPAVAAVLGITQQPGRPLSETVAAVLASRELLLVLDNCEHVVDVVAGLVEAILSYPGGSRLLVTSREGLRVGGEQLWPVSSLDVRDGGEAVELFVERARAVDPSFDPQEGGNTAVVNEICRRLDGIALAIELAAARMVSMTATDLRDRLDDRFRLLAGSRRAIERHQTLHQTVQWSFDLLTADEQSMLCRCSVFANGFDLAAATAICAGAHDEYEVMSLLDSLIRKSLANVVHSSPRTRYVLLETIRQFANDQHASSGQADLARLRHAGHFAEQTTVHLARWGTADQRSAYEWLDIELPNLRAAFRDALSRGNLEVAAEIVNGTAFIGPWGSRHEPVAWAEELLRSPGATSLRQAAGIYTGAAYCALVGRVKDALAYATAAISLIDSPNFDRAPYCFELAWYSTIHLLAGEFDRFVEIAEEMRSRDDDELLETTIHYMWARAVAGRFGEVDLIADDIVARARATRSPFSLSFALGSYGTALETQDPLKALTVYREAVSVAKDGLNRQLAGVWGKNLATLEAEHGNPAEALEQFDQLMELFGHSGDPLNQAQTLASLAVCLQRIGLTAEAATLYGHASQHRMITKLFSTVRHASTEMQTQLGTTRFDHCVTEGALMDMAQITNYARRQIRAARTLIRDRNAQA